MISPFKQVLRQWHFARHVPIRQLVARLTGKARRQAYGFVLFRPKVQGGVVFSACAGDLHLPPLPQAHRVVRGKKGWQADILGHRMIMSDDIAWAVQPDIRSRQLWRMTLHYMEWLDPLGLADGLAALMSWINANRPYSGGWNDVWHSYTMSLRAVAWMRWLGRHHQDVPDDALRAILNSLALQLSLICANPETDVCGNHIIKNIKALLHGAALLACPDSARWRKLATRLLRREIKTQLLPDGTHFELSPSYHCQVFADLLEIRAVTGASWFDDRLAAMALAASLLTHADGQIAQLGDSGLTMTVPTSYCLELWHSISGKKPFLPAGGFALPDAGYYGYRGPNWMLIADLGRIGPDALPAHAHADIGTFELSVGDQRMIVDQGVFEYVAGEKRETSRKTWAHNCLTLGSASQADVFGAFRCGKRPDVVAREFQADGGGLFARATHNGYGAIIVTRSFDAREDHIVIRDHLSRASSLPVSLSFLLHPECTAVASDAGWRVERGGAAIAIIATGTQEIRDAVWWPDMGREVPTQRLSLTLDPGCIESETIIRIVACA